MDQVQITSDGYRWDTVRVYSKVVIYLTERLLTDAFITPHTAVGFGASASNTDNVAQFGFMQVINGNYHK